MLIRSLKSLLVFAMALMFAVIVVGNVFDFEANLRFISHVMSMDTLPQDSAIGGRAIANEVFHHIALWIIIFWQAAITLILLLGGVALWGERDSGSAFQQAKGTAILGLFLGLFLYLVVFLIIGGEWFAMWQSKDWNAQSSSFRFAALFVFALVILLFRDDRPGD